jgi:hypothetical protein
VTPTTIGVVLALGLDALRVGRLAVAIAVASFLLVTPGAAFADSIVYEKDGNVWLASPDGARQVQVTTSGGFTRPTQADDGTIVAVKDTLLQRLDRRGNVLNSAGDSDYGGPITPHIARDGTRVLYTFFATGPILTGPYIAVSHADRPTENYEIDGPLSGYVNGSWLDNSRAVIFPTQLVVDAQIWTVPGGVQDWFEDSGADLGGGEADAGLTRFAAAADGGAKIRLYRLTAPPPAAPEPACDIIGPAGTFFRPTWSPDGSRLAWQEDDGIHVGSFDLATCAGDGPLVIPGAKAPDWGPADLPPAADTARPALGMKAPRRVRMVALLKVGLALRGTCSEACKVTADLMLDRRVARRLGLATAAAQVRIGRATKRLAAAGATTMRLRPSAKARRRVARASISSVTVRAWATDSAGNRSSTVRRKVVVRR